MVGTDAASKMGDASRLCDSPAGGLDSIQHSASLAIPIWPDGNNLRVGVGMEMVFSERRKWHHRFARRPRGGLPHCPRSGQLLSSNAGAGRQANEKQGIGDETNRRSSASCLNESLTILTIWCCRVRPSDPGGDAKEVGQRMPAEETCATRTGTPIADSPYGVKQNDSTASASGEGGIGFCDGHA